MFAPGTSNNKWRLIAFITKKITNYTRRYFSEQQKQLGEVNGFIQESISSLKVIKVFGRETRSLEQFREINERLRLVGVKAQSLSGSMGPMMNSMRNLTFLVIAVSQHFTVYNYDRRGRGDSGDIQPYDIEREIEDLQAIIDEAGGSANVWGLSSGAVLALQAAAKGLNITKLALHGPPFVVDPADRKSPDNFVTHVTELIAANRRAETIKYFMTKGMGAPSFVVALMRVMPGVWSSLMAVAHTLRIGIGKDRLRHDSVSLPFPFLHTVRDSLESYGVPS